MRDQQAEPKTAEIERIVREVLAQLERQAARAPSGEITIDEKIVTLGTLAGRLEGVRQLVVQAGAVMTPAVCDELRARSIGVVRRANTKEQQVAGVLVLGLAETSYDPTALVVAVVKQGIRVERVAQSGLASVVDELGAEARNGGKPGLLITEAADLALCLANRHRGVQAVLGRSVSAVRSAVGEIGANLLVLETKGHGVWELMRIVREFAMPTNRACADAWKEHLG